VGGSEGRFRGGPSYNQKTVPLSEHEQRILEEIEKNLYDEDPRFARDVKRRSPRLSKTARMRAGAALFAAGFATLFAFFILGSVVLGVIAFVMMVAGIVLLAGSVTPQEQRGDGNAQRDHKARLVSFLNHWEERVRGRYKRH
jgi:hypothetical protein